MTSNTNTPPSLEEAMHQEDFYTAAVDSARNNASANALWERGLSVTGWIETETRRNLINMLGKTEYDELVGERTIALTPQIITNVIGRMSETRRGIGTLLHDVIPDLAGHQINFHGTPTALSTLVRDPESEDARMLSWYYENVNPAGANKERAFQFIGNAADAQRLNLLLKIREMYDQLVADESNNDIGETGLATPDPNTQIGALEIQHAAAVRREAAAQAQMTAALSAKPDANVAHFGTQIDKATEAQDRLTGQIAALGKKRTALKSKLDEFDTSMKTLVPGFTMNTTNRAAHFSKATLDRDIGASAAPVTLFTGLRHPLQEYFTNKDVRAATDGFSESFRRGGTRLPAARDVLDRLMKQEYGATMQALPAEQQAAFMNSIKGSLRSAQAPAAGATAATAANQPAADGGSTVLGWMGKKIADTWKWGWDAKDGTSFLGFYTQPDDDK